jgi:hypothetical protein
VRKSLTMALRRSFFSGMGENTGFGAIQAGSGCRHKKASLGVRLARSGIRGNYPDLREKFRRIGQSLYCRCTSIRGKRY